MYLPNYPFGHIVEFQLEEHLAQFPTKQAFADEIMRIYKLGKLTPNQWMQQAVGAKVSTTPILNAVEAILKKWYFECLIAISPACEVGDILFLVKNNWLFVSTSPSCF